MWNKEKKVFQAAVALQKVQDVIVMSRNTGICPTLWCNLSWLSTHTAITIRTGLGFSVRTCTLERLCSRSSCFSGRNWEKSNRCSNKYAQLWKKAPSIRIKTAHPFRLSRIILENYRVKTLQNTNKSYLHSRRFPIDPWCLINRIKLRITTIKNKESSDYLMSKTDNQRFLETSRTTKFSS